MARSRRTGLFGEAIARAEAYRAAGADGVFVPGLATDTDIRAVVSAVDAPVNILYLPGRHTVGRLAELGVRRISTGSLLFRAAIHAAVTTAQAVARDEPVPTDVPTYAEINQLATRFQGAGPLATRPPSAMLDP